MASYGFVYVLTNAAMPGIVKIGFTERSPRARADELSGSTSVPCAFQVYSYVETEDPQASERAVHLALAEHRVSQSREFFRMPAWDAHIAICNYSQYIAESVSSSYDDDSRAQWERLKLAQVGMAGLNEQQALNAAMFGNVHDWWIDMPDDHALQTAVPGAANVIEFNRKSA